MDEKPLRGDSFVVRESQHYRSDAINGRFVARGVIATVIAIIIILTILVIVLGSLLGKARSSAGGEVDDKCKGKYMAVILKTKMYTVLNSCYKRRYTKCRI